jgi:hypothetical protein
MPMAVKPSIAALVLAFLAATAFPAAGWCGTVLMQDDAPQPSFNESLSAHGIVALGTADEKVAASTSPGAGTITAWNAGPELSSGQARLADTTHGTGWLQRIGSWLESSAALVGR